MTVFRTATLRTFFFAFHAGAKELKYGYSSKNLISLYILPDQRRGNLLVFNIPVSGMGNSWSEPSFTAKRKSLKIAVILLSQALYLQKDLHLLSK